MVMLKQRSALDYVLCWKVLLEQRDSIGTLALSESPLLQRSVSPLIGYLNSTKCGSAEN
jgi:hypothetical protein